MEFRRKRRSSVEIGLIPMIDVLLVLLFFFMVATTFRHQAEIKLNLPKADGTETALPKQMINLYVADNGSYRLDAGEANPASASLNRENLITALKQLPVESRQWSFVISADGKAAHQAVITALDLASQQGFYQFSFAVENESAHQ